MSDGDELYGDLETSGEEIERRRLEAELKALETVRRSLEERFSALQKREKALQKENDVLTKNISSLFNTAKQEIARKDKWIDQLRREIHQLQGKLRENGISER